MEFRQRLPGASGARLIPLFCVVFLFAERLFGQEFQLAPPQIDIGLPCSPIFSDSLRIDLHFDLPGAEIRYTLDGTSPDRQSTLFTRALTLRKSCLLRAIALHPDFRASEPAQMQCVRVDPKFQPKSAWLLIPPNPKYPGKGVTTLLDFQKGHNDLNGNQWLGFDGKNLDYTVALAHRSAPNQLLVSTLLAPASWIYPPSRISVWVSRRKKVGYRKVSEYTPEAFTVSANGMEEKIYTLPLRRHRARYWRVLVENYGELPEGYPGKGNPAWLFVDEIILQ